VRQLLRPRERRIKVLPRLLWIAQMPQGSGRNAAPHHLGIVHGIGDRGMVRLWIVERQPVVDVRADRRKHPLAV
jgi:hypothetical protein